MPPGTDGKDEILVAMTMVPSDLMWEGSCTQHLFIEAAQKSFPVDFWAQDQTCLSPASTTI